MNIPELKLPPPGDAYLCLSNFQQQGVVELRNVSRITVGDHGVLTVYRGGDFDTYEADDVWAAWLGWPIKWVHTKHGMVGGGPVYFLEMVWKDWEWDDRGTTKKKHLVNPVKSSIWCDETNTDHEIMVCTVNLGHQDWHPIGWARKSRVNSQDRVLNWHHPFMPS